MYINIKALYIVQYHLGYESIFQTYLKFLCQLQNLISALQGKCSWNYNTELVFCNQQQTAAIPQNNTKIK